MKIITVNLPMTMLKAIDSLVGMDGLYPSRSELVRVALRDYVKNELKKVKSVEQFERKREAAVKNPILRPGMKIRVPTGMTLDQALESGQYSIVSEAIR